MVSIKDIAKKAGVSISTVSYALNGNPKVTEDTSAKILAIAKELNYVPNAAARSLKTRQTNIIGVFLTNYGGAFYGQLLHGMQEALASKGYELIVCSGKHTHRFLPERLIDGAIVLDIAFSSEEILKHADTGHKIVVMDRELDHPNINQVLLHNRSGATLAMDHLIEKGHRKIYTVTGPQRSYDAMQRLEAVRQAVERYNDIEYSEIPGNFNKPAGEKAAEQIVKEYTRPVGVFCANDEMAIGMYNYLSKTNFRVGEHIHIIGFDNIELSQYIKPRLATIDFSERKWGAVAAEQVLKLIANQPVENERIYTTFIPGDSVREVR
ncbi:LacI family transcriptional regulator [Neobacillus notoginsengisoli]|uniref:LacI family transcriptional regulator n=1 Tax=Neobacillus notoginsengisoli TaxID=1578198 RepID=A0A417Z123_9BACI|nr:LacI family DNA-binding transcriptional regulator [Neobacillus notoginsengisoli]RHW43558.1 LacI family transcriptional regulator [Neobacillus notoginsengisoli]